MEPLYAVSAEAQDDLFEIWRRIAEDSVTLAHRIEDEFYELFASLGRMPGQGRQPRKDITSQPVLLVPRGISAGGATNPHSRSPSRQAKSSAHPAGTRVGSGTIPELRRSALPPPFAIGAVRRRMAAQTDRSGPRPPLGRPALVAQPVQFSLRTPHMGKARKAVLLQFVA